ncbi:homoprotocatechuate degradation operon regulator HpaR [Simonsiella muelleri]|uniref:Homoprotocatechuate degradation operon regulator, HpaR n=1 Tax=Simonsiella muelleri ATCC 29453 TaxID=641147 RepID=V9HMG5_9NEIS|nr:homoprotocatechuate degradation operon regulator HpaR [Simonsiella muelleri]AUX61310.1 homoprotocatechuate degradation operon regulator, HpaR [Simonsiella muelleri ATCC 29453]EFG31182.1 homoprotocatechuate degradation operon regulator, HpaR [Simonsiella muelleri ATCC 29453]UBQ53365.1 homoprotocatechuate degradation operon regulator HpaR [Simonsiella muelleri]
MTEATQQQLTLNILLVQARDAVVSYYRPVLNQAGITEQQWRIIRLLSQHGTLDFQELSQQTSILRPSLTGILTRLEKLELVMRLKPASDQRRVFLKLTENGLQLFERISLLMDEQTQQLENDFSGKKLQQLENLLKELSNLNQQNANEAE